MRVASPDDTLAGKMKAWGEPTRRQSKQAKDFTDIVRLVDPHSQLWQRLTPKLRPLVKTAGSLRRAFSRSSSFVTITAVPEPATLVLLALAWLARTESLRMNSKKHSPEQRVRTYQVCRMVPKQVAYTVTRCVPKTVYREVPCCE